MFAVALTGCSATNGDEADASASGTPARDSVVSSLLTSSTTASSGSARSATAPASDSASSTVEAGSTPPGAALQLGERAVVAYTANPAHHSLIRLTVTRVRQGKPRDLRQFQLSDSAKKSRIYYVSAAVKNVGNGNLGGQPVQLYGAVSRSLVVQPVILGSTFEPCASRSLPDPFRRGDSADVCVLLLAPHHGKITDIQWRPADDSEPISWTTRR